MFELKIAVTENENQMSLLTIQNDEKSTFLFDSIEVLEQNPDLVIVNNNFQYGHILGDLEKLKNICPIITQQDWALTEKVFKTLPVQQVIQQYKSFAARWSMQNNLLLIEQIFNFRDHLFNLYLKDRNAFFEELWHLLKKNLAASELTILFHDVREPSEDKKNERPVLVDTMITGKNKPNIKECDEKEKVVMKYFKDQIVDPFKFESFNEEKAELVYLCHINQSPIIVMAKTLQNSAILRSTLSSLFTALQSRK
jgi:hypothetical protein